MADPTDLGGALDTSHVLERGFLAVLRDSDDLVAVSGDNPRSKKINLIKEKRHEIFVEGMESLYEDYSSKYGPLHAGYRLSNVSSDQLELFLKLNPDITASFPDFFEFDSEILDQRVRLPLSTGKIHINEVFPDCPGLSDTHKTYIKLLAKTELPMIGGQQILLSSSAGTMGGWVRNKNSGKDVIISNRHVIGVTGTKIFGPTNPNSPVFETIDLDNNSSGSMDFNDFAIAEPIKGLADHVVPKDVKDNYGFWLKWPGTPFVRGRAEAKVGEPVFKVGASTGLTEGRVVSCSFHVNTDSVRMNYFSVFSDTFFSTGGDSGSLIIKKNQHEAGDYDSRRILGLLYGSANQSAAWCYYDNLTDCIDINSICERSNLEVYPY